MDAGHNGSLGRKRDAKTFCFRVVIPQVVDTKLSSTPLRIAFVMLQSTTFAVAEQKQHGAARRSQL